MICTLLLKGRNRRMSSAAMSCQLLPDSTDTQPSINVPRTLASSPAAHADPQPPSGAAESMDTADVRGSLAECGDLGRGLRKKMPSTKWKGYITSMVRLINPVTSSLSPDSTRKIDALERNGTWTVTDLPPGKKAIGCSLSPPRIPKESLVVLYFLYSHNPSGKRKQYIRLNSIQSEASEALCLACLVLSTFSVK
ncbi:unnamed protein product [Amaranthus hypochondriacus]